MTVVAVQPACKRSGAGRFRGVGANVGPFVQQGVVEALNFAVGLRPGRAKEMARRSGPALSARRRRQILASRRSPTWAMGGGASDAPAEQESTLRGEWSVTVSHEDLREICWLGHLHTYLRRSSRSWTPTAS